MKRRIAFVTAVAMLLSLGVPEGAVPDGGGFPLSGLWTWLQHAPAWADPGGLPAQPSAGGAEGADHDASSDATRANGGAGKAQGRGRGAVDADVAQPERPKPWTAPPLSGEESFDEKKSERIESRSKGRSDDFQNADGSFTRRIWAG